MWGDRLQKLVQHGLSTFFPKEIAYEPTCEPYGTCTTDMKSFKGYIHRWYATATKLAPIIAETVLPVLQKSATAAVAQCTGGDNGRTCGFKWASGSYDGNTGAGQEMNVLGAVSSLLIDEADSPVTADSGGTSKGNPNAGSDSNDQLNKLKPITTGDKAGAALLTIIVLVATCTVFGWMSYGNK